MTSKPDPGLRKKEYSVLLPNGPNFVCVWQDSQYLSDRLSVCVFAPHNDMSAARSLSNEGMEGVEKFSFPVNRLQLAFRNAEAYVRTISLASSKRILRFVSWVALAAVGRANWQAIVANCCSALYFSINPTFIHSEKRNKDKTNP